MDLQKRKNIREYVTKHVSFFNPIKSLSMIVLYNNFYMKKLDEYEKNI